jgi:serine phosphatase RsbU (regulator of sigma subunit)
MIERPSQPEAPEVRRAVDAQHPWPGLLAFDEQDRDFFFGRDAESEELLALVLNYRLTTLYGLSGLGKSSLLRAGLFPRLRDRDFLPVHVRLDLAPRAPTASDQLFDALVREFQANDIEAPDRRGDESLWEYLHRHDVEFWSTRHRLLTPVFVLDQFEEIFSRLPRDAAGHEVRAQAVETVGDLSEGRVPRSVKSLLERRPERAHDFSFADHRYRVLLSIREDYLPDLDELAADVPSLRRSRMRLTHMRGSTAAAAVLAAGSPAGILGVDVAFQIVRFVGESDVGPRGDIAFPDLPIEPALLSVVCFELNQERLRRGRPTITTQQLTTSDAILSRFYDEAVRGAPPALLRFIEDRLITSDGTREIVAIQTITGVPGVTEADVQKLIDNRILRVEHRRGRRLIELTHDRLAPIVSQRRELRQQESDPRVRRAANMVQLSAILEALEGDQPVRGLEKVLQAILGSALDLFGGDAASVLLREPSGEIRPRARVGNPASSVPEVTRELAERTFRSARISTWSDQDASSSGADSGRDRPPRSALLVPLIVDDRVIGVLNIDSRSQVFPDSESAATIAESFASNAATAIQSVRRYEEMAERSRNQQVSQIARSLQELEAPGTRRGATFDAAAASVPCPDIGGDFFDYVDLSGGRIAIALGDASGHGPHAALLSALIRGMLVAQLPTGAGSVAEVVTRTNEALAARILTSSFATIFYAVLDPDGKLTYSNAGHEPPFLIANERVVRLESTGPIVGPIPNAHFDEATETLGDGDVLVVFSDGVYETMSASGERFDEERILSTVREARGGSARDILQHLLATIRKFSGEAPPRDDVTALVLKFGTPPPNQS